MDDLREGRAVYQDITHDSVSSRGEHVPPRTPEAAGEILARLSREHAFTLFEFFQTDKAGHAMDRAKAVAELRKLERFLGALLEHLDLATTHLVVTSDHGNIEDLGRKTHTLNPVPTLVFGPGAEAWGRDFTRLEYLAPRFLDALGAAEKGPS
jgi:bisphosphoglycerate-independent phosphoglycerate mutase (AlkP superfamily)